GGVGPDVVDHHPVVESLMPFTEVEAYHLGRRAGPFEVDREIQAGHTTSEAGLADPSGGVAAEAETLMDDSGGLLAPPLHGEEVESGSVVGRERNAGHGDSLDVVGAAVDDDDARFGV